MNLQNLLAPYKDTMIILLSQYKYALPISHCRKPDLHFQIQQKKAIFAT